MIFQIKKEGYSYSEGTLSVLGLIAEPILQTGNFLSIFVLNKPKSTPILFKGMNNLANTRYDKFEVMSTR